MTNFLKNRRSVRDFRIKSLGPDVLDRINKSLRELENENKKGGFKFRLYENGENIHNALEGIAGYSGVMIEAPHYIAIELLNKEDETVIYSGYYMERLITELNEMGLDSCWISVFDVDMEKRKEVFGEATNEINFILAFGVPKRKNPFVPIPFSERKSVEEIVYDNELGKPMDVELLETRGLGDIFFYSRFAPSIRNQQPWRFIVTSDKVHLLIEYEDGKNPPLIDAGVIMYYFEALAYMQGVKHKWALLDGFVHEGNTNYKYIAEYQL